MSIKVIANAVGYFDGRLIEPGTAFAIESEEQLGAWMDVVEDEAPAKPAKPAK